jgi:hypothetical protein
MWFDGLVLRPEDDRFIGQAQVPLPVTAVPYTEPLYLSRPPVQKPRRGCLFYAGLATVLMLVCVLGAAVGLTFGRDLISGSHLAAPPRASVPSPTPARPSPKAVTEKFLSATISGDQKTAQQSMCKLWRGEGNGDGGADPQQEWLALFVDYKVGAENIKGPSASVNVELTLPVLGKVTLDVYLIQEEDAWRVCGMAPA